MRGEGEGVGMRERNRLRCLQTREYQSVQWRIKDPKMLPDYFKSEFAMLFGSDDMLREWTTVQEPCFTATSSTDTGVLCFTGHMSCNYMFLHDAEPSEKPQPRVYMIMAQAVNVSENKASCGRINSVMNESNCLCYCVFICRFNIVCWTPK